ncbi:MAG: S41 family peptidase [Bacteroidota bacterium]
MRSPLFLLLLAVFISQFAFGQPPQTIQNLETFGKVYGYIRYFHPSDEAADLDWDKFAIYGCQQVENAKNPAELKTTLQELFLPIAPTLQLFDTHQNLTFSVKDITPPDPKSFKTIGWQHKGIGMGNNKQSPYRSARTNRPIIYKASGGGFGNITTYIDAKPYRNQEFRLTASVKNTEINGSGSGHLWARVDRENKKMGFFDNMGNRPIINKDWTAYEIKGTLSEDALELYFGCFLQGEGKLWVDNITLFIKQGSEWKEMAHYDFESDQVNEFPKSWGEKRSDQPNYTILVSAESAANGQKSVAIASKVEKDQEAARYLFAEKASLGEVIREEVGSGLTCLIPLVLYGTKEYTYPKADTGKLAALKKTISSLHLDTLSGNNRHLRLADVLITWNIFQHFYPYFDVAKTDWKGDLTEAIKASYPDQSAYDFLQHLRKFTAKLKDGHIWVIAPAESEQMRLPIEWEWIENQLVITRVLDDSLPVKRGDIVTMINGQSPKQYFQDIEQYISAATKGWLKHRSKNASLEGSVNSTVQLQFKAANATTQTCTLIHNVSIGDFYASKPQNDTTRQIAPSIYYINMDQTPMENINQLLPELAKAKAIICDLRGYPKGNHEFISHLLTQKDTTASWMRIPKIIRPDQKQLAGYVPEGWAMEPKKPHLNAKIIFITDGRAISYAESFMGYIEGYKLAIIIGQPTAGTNGNVNPFILPGKYRITWTGMKVLKHNGTQHHGVGILPNIYLEKTIAGVREGRDEFLEKALELANAKQ